MLEKETAIKGCCFIILCFTNAINYACGVWRLNISGGGTIEKLCRITAEQIHQSDIANEREEVI